MEMASLEKEPLTKQKDPHKKRKALFCITAFFVLCGVGYFSYWVIHGRYREYTSDAYVSGNMLTITPLVSGIVTQIYAQDTNFIPQNQILIELDKTDYQIALEKTKDQLAAQVRNVAGLFAEEKQLEAEIEIKKAKFVKAAQDFEHRKNLVETGGVSREDYEHAAAELASNFYSLIFSEQKLLGILSKIENTTIATHPLVQEASEAVKIAWIHLQRCTIYAPATGIVAQRTVQVGKWVDKGEPLLSIIPIDQIWVDANFKEVQLKKMLVGQKAKVTSDIYGDDVKYQGTVFGIGGGTGSAFSVLPPQNATGNWIKIVQRVPVRINLDPEIVKQYPLRIGLSMEVTVDLKDQNGTRIPAPLQEAPIYETEIFANEEDGVGSLIEQIIAENMPSFAQELESGLSSENLER